MGKSGALRVLFVYFEKYGHVLLSIVYRKGDLDDISDQTKKSVNQVISRIEVELKKQYGF